MAELVDALHSKCNIERCVSSSPTSGTKVAEHVPQVSCRTLLVKALTLRCYVLYLVQILNDESMKNTSMCMSRCILKNYLVSFDKSYRCEIIAYKKLL